MTLQQLQVSHEDSLKMEDLTKKMLLKLYALGATFCEVVCEIEI